jgi:pyruvate dehydrogenase E2 component (dihydrolipoamide acetyltransferase)
MAEIIRMPRMSDTMEEGVIVGWEKKVGDEIEPGDLLAEIETDKATMEFESVYEGVLLHIEVAEGAVPVNGVIAVIGDKGEDFKSELEKALSDNGSSNGEEEKTESADTGSAEATVTDAPAPATESSSPAQEPAAESGRIKASPLARSMAQEAGIELSTLTGSGENGRIVKRDIEEAISRQKSTPAPAPAPAAAPVPQAQPQEDPSADIPAFSFSGEDTYEEVTVSQMRKTIARRLGESKFGAPHFYLTIEVNMGKAIELRKSLNEYSPTKISFNDLVVKAVAMSLRHHPKINSSWMGDKIRRHKQVHIGVAVAVEEGLLVPVIRHADMKTFSQLNVEVKELALKAKSKKLQPEEMQGNTFTISNLGMFGIEEFTAIINPPDSCILAIGGIIQKPIVENGEMVVGNMMKVTLSCDHRVVDGATGAEFLQTFKGILEEPVRFMI